MLPQDCRRLPQNGVVGPRPPWDWGTANVWTLVCWGRSSWPAAWVSHTHTVTAPPGARKKKSATPEDAYPAIRSGINTSYVSRAIASRSDYQLPTLYLHFHHKTTPANSEDSFLIMFGILNQTDNLLLSRWQRDVQTLSRPHSSVFLFACPANSTALGPLDLWVNPLASADGHFLLWS